MSNSSSDARHTEQIDFHGLPALRLRASGSEARVFLHGAHVAAFRTEEHGDLLWTSAQAVYEAGKAIRGGIPVCFPWFGAHATRPDLPAHGFARTRGFRFEGSEARGDEVVAVLALDTDDETRRMFGHELTARVMVRVGRRLSVAFEVENRDEHAFSYELALHTYLRVSDVREIDVLGLEGTSYDDKVTGERAVLEGQTPLRFSGEMDRVYDTTSRAIVRDGGLGRRIIVDKIESGTTVVWNPWIDKAKRMADFGDDEWPGMLCIEAGNTGQRAVTVPAGARHATTTHISAEPL